MAQREVITFICDNCGGEDDLKEGQILPTGWMEILFTENSQANEPVQTCQLCTDAVAKALAERRGDIAPSK
jgi:hypothetical protein